MELWQRFTHRARQSILLAHEEATHVGQHQLGTEHLLLGVIRLGEGLGTEVLRGLDVDLLELRADVRRSVLRNDASAAVQASSDEISFTPEAQHVLQLAYEEARELDHRHIGTEHILLGLAREAHGAASRALHKQKVTADQVRGAILARECSDDVAASPEAAVIAARELLRRAHAAAADMRTHLEKAEALLGQIADLVEEPPEKTGSEMMDRETLTSDRIPPAVGPYSQAVRAEGMIFCSGVIGLDPETKQLVEDSFEAQVRRVMDNLTMLLEDCDAGLDRVVKTTVFLVDMGQFAAFNAIYAEYFDEAPPARSTIQVAALPLGAQIEVEAISIA